MIEVVFSDSALGSLKIAQNFGQGKYQGGAMGILIGSDDGRKPTEEDIEAARKEAMEKARLEWESSTPMGGKPSDIFGFNLTLSVGDISETQPAKKRKRTLQILYGVYPNDDGHQAAEEILSRADKDLKEIRDRTTQGEAIRIWYGSQPDEMCGMYWFMYQLSQWKEHQGNVSIVRLPEWEEGEKGCIVRKSSWSELHPGEWVKHVPMQRNAPPVFIHSCAARWKELKAENAPLRAVLNGQLVGMSEKLYDDFIACEIEAEDGEFREAMIIGRVLGKYRLGIGDAWVALRIEEMINDGRLEIVTPSAKDMPVYHRVLRKIAPIL